MGYTRNYSMGDDGPITHPSQVDDSIIVGTVPPKRVECAALPADSPWRKPGQVCAPSTGLTDLLKGIAEALTQPIVGAVSAATPPAPTATPASTGPSLLLLAVLGGAGYYLLRKKR